MRRKEYYWSIYNRHERKQLDELRTDQVEAIFEALPNGHHVYWLIWKEGFKNWKPFQEFPLLLQGLRRSKDISSYSPPPPPKEAVAPVAEIEAGVDDEITLEIETEAVSDNRSHGRFEGKFKVTITEGDQAFQTSTVNVSMNGMQLKDPLPAWVPKYFTVELGMGPMSIPLLCSRVRSQNGGPDNRLRIDSNDHHEVLRTWIISIGRS